MSKKNVSVPSTVHYFDEMSPSECDVRYRDLQALEEGIRLEKASLIEVRKANIASARVLSAEAKIAALQSKLVALTNPSPKTVPAVVSESVAETIAVNG
jgi:hypothetical protein